MNIKTEKIDGTLHRRLFVFPGIEYEKDYNIIYINIYFLKWKIIYRVKTINKY